MVHFNWTQLIPGVDHHNIHIATAIVAGLFMTLMAVSARVSLGSGEKAITPSGRFSIKGFFEVITEFIIGLTDMVVGEHGRKFAPMFAAIFFYILVNNLFGLIPGMTPATDNLNTTIGVGLFSFVAYNVYGFKEHGFAYLKHFLGPITKPAILAVFIIPLMLVIELISHTVRPVSLGLRLYGNMLGDHTVLSVFLDLVPWFVPMIFYGLGMFVCFMQAFVFTMLSMIYISLAISHDH